MNKFILSTCAVISFLVGVLFVALFIEWGFIKSDFCSMRLIEVLQVVVDLVIAIFVAYYLSTKTHNEQKQKQIRSEFLDGIHDFARETYHDALKYMDAPCMLQSRVLLLKFDELIAMLSLFDAKKELGEGIDKTKVKVAFFEFKESITSGAFHVERATFSGEEKRSCINKYSAFSTELMLAKLGLYNE